MNERRFLEQLSDWKPGDLKSGPAPTPARHEITEVGRGPNEEIWEVVIRQPDGTRLTAWKPEFVEGEEGS